MGRLWGPGIGTRSGPHTPYMGRRFSVGILTVVACLGVASPAWSHTLYVLAHVEGTTIQGRAYFRGNSPAQNVQVIARNPAGKELGRTTTNEQGAFSLSARVRCDHKLLVDTGDGHGAERTVRAEELPASLPAGDSVGRVPSLPVSPGTEPSASPLPAPPSGPAAAPTAGEPTAAQIDELKREVVALGEQIAGYEQQVRVRDILGGIGYVVGATGVAYYVLARNRGDTKAGR
jgi:nickel transport protein